MIDQGATNVNAINNLIAESRHYYVANNKPAKNYIVVDNMEVIPLNDVPHLLKGMHNNLLSKYLIWKKDGEEITAKWADIETAYDIDIRTGDMRSLPKVTGRHIGSHKIKKMKVAYAAQVFSRSMAVTISNMSRNGNY